MNESRKRPDVSGISASTAHIQASVAEIREYLSDTEDPEQWANCSEGLLRYTAERDGYKFAVWLRRYREEEGR